MITFARPLQSLDSQAEPKEGARSPIEGKQRRMTALDERPAELSR